MDGLDHFLKNWRLALLFMLIGGTAGYFISGRLPFQYAASAHLNTSIDFSRTGSLDDIQQDQMLGIAEDIINSDAVLAQVCAETGGCSVQELRQHSRVNRTSDQWLLTVIGSDPEQAARQASEWLNTAWDALYAARDHAEQGEAYEASLTGMENCAQRAVEGVPPADCGFADFSQLQSRISELSGAAQREQQAAHGMPSAILFGEKDSGQIELKPASRTRGFLTFCGAAAGLLAALAGAFLMKPSSKAD